MIDNELFYSCMMPAIRAVGKKITTIEGLEKDGVLSAVQQGFVDHFAFQCGYCTPGMIMSGTALLAEIPNPTEDQIKEGIGGADLQMHWLREDNRSHKGSFRSEKE